MPPIDPRLKEACELKNKLVHWLKESNQEYRKIKLGILYKSMENSNLEAFQSVKKTFQRWKKEVVHSFMYLFNNGYIEGVNNIIKVLKCNSFGIKSFERMKKKILWQQKVKKSFKVKRDDAIAAIFRHQI
ncbi:transposase [Virgibacillus proomii]|uniref:transposase n=1 Tax=Virgibacillus proomii TaxID=84407 RepID=UPI001C121B26|nr:transposase [Virgibacillus proomii]MBU5267591.1 transposase [Virgibacillus proomii]